MAASKLSDSFAMKYLKMVERGMVRNVPHSRQNCCLSHRKDNAEVFSSGNWPELGMEWLLVTFVTSLSVKWRLMTSFYRMSNKLFIHKRGKQKYSVIKKTNLFT